MATFNVTDAASLTAALRSASGGDEILLSAGDYGGFAFNGYDFGSYVTVRSADPDDPATFDRIDIEGSSFLAIEDVHIDNPTNGSPASKIVNIDGGSHDIRFANSEVNGSVSATNDFAEFVGHYGIYVGDARDVDVIGNDVHDLKNGLVAIGADDLDVVGNTFDRLGNDAMKFAGVDGVLIEDNFGPREVYPAPGAHLDFIQFQSSSQNIVIRGNVYLAGNTPFMQAILMDDGRYDNVLIEQNILYTGMIHGIWLFEGSNVTMRDNTVLNSPTGPHKATIIRSPEGATVEGNLISQTSGSESGGNLFIQHRAPNSDFYYDDYFVNARAGTGITLEDLTPIAGSGAETFGAHDRLMELLTGDPVFDTGGQTPDDFPSDGEPPAPPTPPEPFDEGDFTISEPGAAEAAAFAVVGIKNFDGAAERVIERAADPALALAAATIALTFSVDAVAGRQGVVSRDASGYDGGDHLTVFIQNGVLNVRFQNGGEDLVFTAPIEAGRDYDLAISFDDGVVSARLDGVEFGSGAYDYDWTNNDQNLQIGASGWASASGASGFVDPFTGSISNLAIFEGALSNDELAAAFTALLDGPAEDPQGDGADQSDDGAGEQPDNPPADDGDAGDDSEGDGGGDANGGSGDAGGGSAGADGSGDDADAGDGDASAGDPPSEAPTAPAFAFAGVKEIDGRADAVVEFAPDQSFDFAAGVIALTFTASDLRGFQGIFSRDASGFDGGDHIAAYLRGDELNIRFQHEETQHVISIDDVEVGRAYDLRVRFDESGVSVELDGAEIGRADIDFDWTGNAQFIQIGANGWASRSGEAGFRDVFSGSLADIVIAEGALQEADIAAILAGPASGDDEDGSDAPSDDGGASDAGDQTDGGAGDAPTTPDANVVLSAAGALEFSGSGDDAIELAHEDAFEIASGTISFSFNADDLNGKQGLIVKDASFFDGGDHLAVYMIRDDLFVRFQADGEQVSFRFDGLSAGVDYGVQLSFGDGRVAASVNGREIGAADFDYDWLENIQFLQVGASGWASKSGEAGFVDPFNGTITDLMIVEGVQTPEDVAAIAASLTKTALQAASAEGSADQFVFNGSGPDVVSGFENGVDKIAVDGVASSFADLKVLNVAGDVVIAADGELLRIADLDAAKIDETDFVF